jgi:hypothetical protein
VTHLMQVLLNIQHKLVWNFESNFSFL